MLNHSDIMSTVDMIDHQHLDIRTITMGISLLDCADPNPEMCIRDSLSDILFDLSVYDLSPVFRRKYDMIFTFPLRVC